MSAVEKPLTTAENLAPGLRVALVHDWLTGMRGGEKVLEELAGLFPAAPIYTLFHFAGSVSDRLESHSIHTSFLQRWPGIARRYRLFLPLFPSAIEDFDLQSYDLIISTSHCVAKGIIPGPHSLHLCYCHTPMRYAWDQEHTYFPNRRGLAARLRNLALCALRTWDQATSSRVDHFIANSRFVARRIQRYYGRAATVIPPPVDVDFFATEDADPVAAGSGAGYALMVSALAPYKRVDLAIKACRELDLELRIVGTGPERRRLAREAGPRVRFLDRVDPVTLRRLYRGARVFLQPGIEDFGIAAVEALAGGAPVVALKRGGVLDIVEDGVHGVLYDDPKPGIQDSRAEDYRVLCAAIDKSLQIRFNKLDLLERARLFSKSGFKERLTTLVARQIMELEAFIV